MTFKYRFVDDKEKFLHKVSQTVQESMNRVYDTVSDSNPLIFTEPKPAHEELVKQILLKQPNSSAATLDVMIGDDERSPVNLDISTERGIDTTPQKLF